MGVDSSVLRRSLVVVAVLAAACGSRASDAQRGALVRGAGAREPVAAADATAESPSAGTATAAPAVVAGTSSPQAPSPVAGGAAPVDNGGATDVGVSSTSVRIGNVSTLSGPVPGLFKGALIGAQAAAAFQNSVGGIHGRRIEIVSGDDQLDSAQNRAVTEDMLDRVFAFAGSLGVYDDASADAVGRSGIPDVTPALSGARRRIANNFNVAPAEEGGTQLAPFTYYTGKFPQEVKAVGTLFGDVPISRAAQMAEQAAGESLGWKFVYSRGYQPTETDFTADVIRMRQVGVKLAFLAGSEPKTLARIANAMHQQNFDIPIVTMNVGYDHQLATLAGPALEGMYTTMAWSMFAGEDAAAVAEVRLLGHWVQTVKPGFEPDLYALLGWASARLLFEGMDRAGPHLTRAGVDDAIRAIGVFDDHGLLAPANPGAKAPPTCIVITVLHHGQWQRVDSPPTGYRCDLGGYFRSRR